VASTACDRGDCAASCRRCTLSLQVAATCTLPSSQNRFAAMAEPSAPPARQSEIYLAGVRGIRPTIPVDVEQLEMAARVALSPEAFAYLAGGAGGESTMRANREAFERWRIVPRMLRDVSRRDTSVELFGRRLPSPVLLSPVGVMELFHRRPCGGDDGCADGVLEPGVGADGALRGRNGRVGSLVPALLEQR